MIGAQIRRVRRLAPQAAAVALGHDYDGRAKPVCDWGDPDERGWLIDDLVTDAQRVLDALDGSELSDEQAQAAALLAVVAGQDVEADPKVPGRWRIARRVAKGRVISTVDPEARHARKSRSQRRDGYKAHICAEPDTGLITAAELTTAGHIRRPSRTPPAPTRPPQPPTTPPTPPTPPLTPPTPTPPPTPPLTPLTPTPRTLRGSWGWCWPTRPTRRARRSTRSRPPATTPPSSPSTPSRASPGASPEDDFTIDTDAQTVTCPAGHTKAVKSGAARFGASCSSCPLRPRCTTSAAGRSVTVDAHHRRRQANKARWARPATQALYRRHRPMAERSIAWLTRNKARRRPLPRRRRQPPLAHHQSRRRQPRAPHQPRRHPQQRRLHPLKRPRRAARPNPTGPTSQPAAPTPWVSPRQLPHHLLSSLLGSTARLLAAAVTLSWAAT